MVGSTYLPKRKIESESVRQIACNLLIKPGGFKKFHERRKEPSAKVLKMSASSSQDGDVGSPLKLNRVFAKNIVKYTQDNNRITTDNQQKQQRKFINEERKKHTKRNLEGGGERPNQRKTMYSDYISTKLTEKGLKKSISTLDQMKKLVKDAAEFDRTMSEKEITNLSGFYVPPRQKKISVDKTLLRNHLRV